MNHEPECPAKEFPYFCACVEIQDAYQRGRKDAAKAVEGLIRQQLGYGKAEWIDDEDYEFVAAARVDGEQA